LDTEFEAQDKKMQDALLASVGLDEVECREIRSKIKYTLLGTLEWQYLGLWDLLAMKQFRNPLYQFTGKKFYWWTMRIALKGSGI
jgi:hypothetical protein